MAAMFHQLFFGFDRHPIPKNKLVNLKKYKYSGVDLSLLSKYVLGPYWNWLVTLFPLWVAPNTITLMGLIMIISSCALVLWHSSTAGSEPPPFLYLYAALSMFIYQSFDAIDGKQARRTGNTGPLGELFDHGCDALNLLLQSLIIPILLRIDSPLLSLAFPCIAFLVFYVSTWEEYNTGILYLGYFSGPVDGQVATILLFLFAPMLGGSFWTTNVVSFIGLDMQVNTLIVSLIVAFALATILGSLHNVHSVQGITPFVQLVPFTLFMIITIATFYFSPDLHRYLNRQVYVATFGTAFACSVSWIIIAHLCKLDFPVWTSSYVPIFMILVWTLNKKYSYFPLLLRLPMTKLLITSLLSNILIYSRLVYCTITQLCDYLNLSCFRVKAKKLSD